MSTPRPKRPSAFLRRWCAEYVLDFNATAATMRAAPRSNPKTAKQRGYLLLHREDTQAELARLEEALTEQAGIKLRRLLEELRAVAYSSIDDFVIDAEGRVQLRDGAPDEALRAVASIKRKQRFIPRKDEDPIIETDTEIRLWSKPEALRLGMQHVGALVDRSETTLRTKDGKPLEVRVVYDDPAPPNPDDVP
ncbi:MAG TPA: terminase small subunit [Gemmatimonadaceae bacterium]|nr:terminase small subunit [Gemmatimonadaceae bacterium]